MICYFNRLLTPSLRKRQKGMDGQIAVILVLFLAVLLVAFSIVLNLGKIAQTKTSLQIAADKTAVQLSSSLASLAESYFQEGFRGQYPDAGDRCGRMCLHGQSWMRKLLETLIDLGIAIAATLAACVPGAAPVMTSLAIGAWTNFAGSAAELGVAIHAANKAGKAWAKMWEGLDINVQIREQGLASALQGVVADAVMLSDYGDYDMNGYYVGDGTTAGDEEKIDRFSYLFSQRTSYLVEEKLDHLPMIRNFQRALGEFYHKGGNTLIWDPVPLDDDGWGLFDVREWPDPPSGTYTANEYDTRCEAKDPLNSQCPSTGVSWKYIYDPYCERYSGHTFESFRRFIGRDDRNKKFFLYDNVANMVTPHEWYGNDATGLFRLLWDLNTTKMLKLTNEQDPEIVQNDLQKCFWTGFYEDGSAKKTSTGCQDYFSAYTEYPQLTLPSGEHCEHAEYENFRSRNSCWSSYYTDENDISKSAQLDPVSLPLPLLEEGECYGGNFTTFSWKKGCGEAQCSTTVPYTMCPGKNCDISCAQCIYCASPTINPCCLIDNCGASSSKASWRDDALDALRNDRSHEGIDGVVRKSAEILVENPVSLLKNFNSWYPNNIEPMIRNVSENPGTLFKWRILLENIKQRLIMLKEQAFEDDARSVCFGTPSEINACYDDILQKIDLCLNDCPNQQGVCQDLVNNALAKIGLYFEEPAPPIGDYAGQATGCELVPDAAYNFLYELENWRAKILHRKNYLFDPDQGLYPRMQAAIEKLQTAQDKIYAFLNDPRVAALRNYDPNASGGVNGQGQVIYAWRDEPKPGSVVPGAWHVVLAEAKIPTLCNGRCRRTQCVNNAYDGLGGDDPLYLPQGNHGHCPVEPDLPNIFTSTFAGSQYYFLLDYAGKGDCVYSGELSGGENYKHPRYCFKGGLTKARVIRYDQDRAGSGILNFATGNFWKMRTEHPGAVANASPDHIPQECGEIMSSGVKPGAWGTTEGAQAGAGAVLLHEPTMQNITCWNLLTGLLARGVEARSCAEYFYRQSPDNYDTPSAFGVRFVDCEDAPDAW